MNESSPSSTCPPDSSLSGHTTDAQNNGNKKISLYSTNPLQTHSKSRRPDKTIYTILFSCHFALYLVKNKSVTKKGIPPKNSFFISTQKFFAYYRSRTKFKASKESTYRSRLVQSKGKDFVELKMKSCSMPLFLQECKHAKTSQSHDLHILMAVYSFVKGANVAACWNGFRVISLRSHGGIISCKPCGFLYKS